MNVLEIALGALLHDIGKFAQRAFPAQQGLSSQSLGMAAYLCPTARHGAPSHLHVLYTNEFVERVPFMPVGLDRGRVANLAAYHHRPDTPEQQIIARADRLSSGMDRLIVEEGQEVGSASFRRVRLYSIASTISLPGCPASPPAPLGLTQLTPAASFPVAGGAASDLTAEYHILWNEFLKAWELNRCEDPLGFINRATSILERFTWCIPSATNAVPDISLFDHLKTTAAIAVCLQQAGASAEEPFLLVGADLTGIQKYLFDIQQGSGRLARRLRARSFKVAAYLESISLALLDRLGLPLVQRILFAGGKFHLLLPNTSHTLEQLEQAKVAVSDWLFRQSAGEVGLCMAAVGLREPDLIDFADSLARLNVQLRAARYRAGESLLVEDGRWVPEAFVLPGLRLAENEALCDRCKKRPARADDPEEPETPICSHCQAEEQIGRRLPSTRYVAFFSSGGQRHVAPLGSFELLGQGQTPATRPQLVIDLDGAADAHCQLPLVGSFRSRYVPHDPKTATVIEFGELASRSQGRAALGCLKMDVDNLGYLFSQGFKGGARQTGTDRQQNDLPDRTSISRVAALSRTLEVFFSGYLEHLLRTNFANVYLIYSGGDDVAAVGPWNEIFALARRLRDEFRRFTGGNPAWTLSAGIAVVNPHVPVLVAIQEADRLLEASKSICGQGVLPWPAPAFLQGRPEKDRITAFDTSIPWSQYPDTLDQATQVLQWLLEGAVSSGQLYRLLWYAEMARQFQCTGHTQHLQYLPYLARDVRRNWPEKTAAQRAARQWAARLALPDSEDMKRARFVCQYALYGSRTPDRGDRT